MERRSPTLSVAYLRHSRYVSGRYIGSLSSFPPPLFCNPKNKENMEVNTTNLHAASDMLRDFYAFDSRLSRLYVEIFGDSVETNTVLRRETDHVEALIKDMIETAAIEGV